MLVSVYKLIFKDADCMKLATSNKTEIGTYTTDKTKVIGSCKLLAVHPDTQCLKEVTFHVTSHEGSVVLSCAATFELSLIQPHSNLESIPSSASWITSNAYYPRKKFQKICKYQSQVKICVQARNNLPYFTCTRKYC